MSVNRESVKLAIKLLNGVNRTYPKIKEGLVETLTQYTLCDEVTQSDIEESVDVALNIYFKGEY